MLKISTINLLVSYVSFFGALKGCDYFLIAAPVGTLAFASVHEAGHVTVAKHCGYISVSARVFLKEKYGVGTFWKGQTTLGKGHTRNGEMALIKLGGRFTEHYLDRSNRIYQPNFIDVIGDRSVISQSDEITRMDLGSDSLLEAQRRTFFILRGRLVELDQIYKTLLGRKGYP